ncbi:UV DNA damage repair endonuclease UvsE [Paenibacillus sp. NEAU-GSW1]|uniref:UV DNA damage repair endonuclease UvsE n=1 Tax=Paenibacillus sp. NEAU-GSW1 TaxID=2682486 RepID=UPI0012E218BD|nr:UV DNA damage repair endonuclease UvsE [Paenibacillus sp. NEAU-GSW1]MUT65581.1 UV DNA damage repair endonuclease UvsE [Paenibacillus sp. NEAU-GSW1]
MIVKFGFVAMSLLLQNASPSRTMTYSNFIKQPDRAAAIRRLEQIAEQNLHTTLRIMKHAAAHDIRLYRFTSKIIPLATHSDLSDWDPYPALADSFSAVGEFVQKSDMRVSFHPDHFCVFSTPRPEVLASSQRDLDYHVRMLEAMGLSETVKNNIHIGGAYGNKLESGDRFVRQFTALPPRLRQRVTLENDDKTFNVCETLEAAEAANVPMVLDIHHHDVNDGGIAREQLVNQYWPRILNTWEKEAIRLGLASPGALPPKIHASSPRSDTDRRSHADGVEAKPLLRFLRDIAASTGRVDCMLEAKHKDAALLKLMEDWQRLEALGEGVRVIDGGSIEITP